MRPVPRMIFESTPDVPRLATSDVAPSSADAATPLVLGTADKPLRDRQRSAQTRPPPRCLDTERSHEGAPGGWSHVRPKPPWDERSTNAEHPLGRQCAGLIGGAGASVVLAGVVGAGVLV